LVSFIADAVEKGLSKRSKEVKTKIVKDSPKLSELKNHKKDVELDHVGISDVVLAKLKEEGIETLSQLEDKKDEELLAMKGLGQKAVTKLKEDVKNYKK
ncbi:MAG: hypothetical protein UR87_C0048G0001, partial [candidate division CPR3 bacterium GW2011_GWE2_35_7]